MASLTLDEADDGGGEDLVAAARSAFARRKLFRMEAPSRSRWVGNALMPSKPAAGERRPFAETE